MTPIEDGEKIRIYVNSNTKMSRGKYAAAAVHAALTAAGVHPGLPVIVLGEQREHVTKHATVIRDAGRTEVERGTPTAGTDWKPTPPTDDERVQGGAKLPQNSDDEREAMLREARARYPHDPDGWNRDRNHDKASGFREGAEWAFRFHRQGPITEAQLHRAVDAFMQSQGETEDGPSLVHKNIHAALEAARDA